jgi:hypothetical protein
VLLVSQRIETGEKISATGFKRNQKKNGKNSEQENQSKQKFVTQEERKKRITGKMKF